MLAVLRQSASQVVGTNLSLIAPAGNTAYTLRNVAAVAAFDNTTSELIGSRFELQTSRSRDKRVTVLPITGRL